MGSSYRSDLNSGYMKVWEDHLRQAIASLRTVIELSWECGNDGQFDNAADDGAFRERLRICIGLIQEELPTKQE